MLKDYLATGQLHFFMLFFIYVWLRWVIIYSQALLYRPYLESHRISAAVIIPVVDEPEAVFRRVLKSICAQRPQQIIVVVNGPRNYTLEKLAKEYKGVRVIWTRKPGKRNAIRVGMRHVTAELTILVDSDTIWTKDTLRELKKPFKDMSIGGVTTRQKILDDSRSLVTLFCSIMEEIRAEGTMKAMSVQGSVGCLPGRTIAFRTSILNSVMKEFTSEKFMGFHKEVSDDRSLTNLTLKLGYKTVAQDTSVVYTDAPDRWKKFIRQQLRWSEGSQYNNLRMFKWYMFNARLTGFIYLTDMIMPFFLVGLAGQTIIGHILGLPNVATLDNSLILALLVAVTGAVLNVSIRQYKVVINRPLFLLYMPAFVIILTAVMVPIRLIGLAKSADDLGWGTRESAYSGTAKAKSRWRRVKETDHVFEPVPA